MKHRMLTLQFLESKQMLAVGQLVANPDVYIVSPTQASTVDASQGLLANDQVPAGDLAVVKPEVTQQSGGGTFDIKADGSLKYTPPASFTGWDRAAYTIADSASGESSSSTVTVLSQHGAVVWKFYESVLGRGPDDQGLQYWMNYLDQGGQTGDMAYRFFESDELLNGIIGNYYQQFLLRPSDPGGLANWKSVWHATGGPEQIKAGFAASPEFFASAGGAPDAWIQALYQRILTRPEDTQGAQYWNAYYQQHLAAQQQPDDIRHQIAVSFLVSKEAFQQDVTGWFQEYLDRAPTQGDTDYFVATMLAGASDRQIEQQISNTPEFANNPPPPDAGSAAPLGDFYPAAVSHPPITPRQALLRVDPPPASDHPHEGDATLSLTSGNIEVDNGIQVSYKSPNSNLRTTITFSSQTGVAAWSDGEINTVLQAIRELDGWTGGNGALLTDYDVSSKGTHQLSFVKTSSTFLNQQSGAPPAGSQWTGLNMVRNGVHTIYFLPWDNTNAADNLAINETVKHEVMHNFDSSGEKADAVEAMYPSLGLATIEIVAFLEWQWIGQSGWVPAPDNHIKSEIADESAWRALFGRPMNQLTAGGQNNSSGNPLWYYDSANTSADFARSYGEYNPYEDWSTTAEVYAKIVNEGDKNWQTEYSGIINKLKLMDSFMALMSGDNGHGNLFSDQQITDYFNQRYTAATGYEGLQEP